MYFTCIFELSFFFYNMIEHQWNIILTGAVFAWLVGLGPLAYGTWGKRGHLNFLLREWYLAAILSLLPFSRINVEFMFKSGVFDA
jgi:hypothetical protein